MTTKADRVRSWLKHSNLSSREIAEAVGCHPGFVRAIKQRMLHPEREIERHRAYYKNNKGGRRDKAIADKRMRWQSIAADPVKLRQYYDRQNYRRRRARELEKAEARA